MVAVERVKSGSKYEEMFKFSRLVKVGNWIYSSNTAGRNYETREMSPDVTRQAHQALDNLSGALAAVGARLSDTVRFHVSVGSPEDLEPVLAVIAERVEANDPAHTIAIGPLPHAEMKLELALIAYIRDPETPDVVTRVTV
ncbi:hypothetical protein VE25_05605 [Devosia geojensis]|uniref:Uncharacterized protein n=1 Tax=Devosia geojensis TaxID=443610 RepID=A0A0F5FX14_9HYPH|nr:Rid family hydrolase [Devosia geojensis]KKB12712.1 hypothetical protein VE25_05605 [Devosia geojensis]